MIREVCKSHKKEKRKLDWLNFEKELSTEVTNSRKGRRSVSYTHLDVYKRQGIQSTDS